MHRLDRLDQLARVLVDRPGISSAELADALRTSVRSVFRDLATLRARGYPIEGGRGRGGGLRLHPNWGLGRVTLATDEALGALIALAVTERTGMPMFGAELAGARRKLIAAFPASMRRQLEPLRERVLVGPPASAAVSRSYGRPSAAATRALQSAFVRSRVIDALYENAKGERVRRRVAPHELLLNWPAWYLLGHDFLRDDLRTFRLDRFREVREEQEQFRPRPAATLASLGGLDAADHGSFRL